jgi:replication initiation protein RepC
MPMENAREASGERYADSPTGFRRLTPGLLKADRAAERFAGLPDGVIVFGQLLAAFKAAAPRLGLSPRLVHAIDWLFRFTMTQDWGRGGRPIVWPSASLQREFLGLSESRVKVLNRVLIEAGLITMKDSPNGKRYGTRDAKGNIVEAYGFDLSPIAARHGEFLRLAAEAKAERVEMGRLRRRATIARKGIIQILETASEYGLPGEEWLILKHAARDLGQALRKMERPEEMAFGVAGLERAQRAARERLESLLSQVETGMRESLDSGRLGDGSEPHQYNYKPAPDPEQDTVVAQKKGSNAGGEAVERKSNPAQREPPETGRVLKLTPDELMKLAPRLKSWLRAPDPTWPDVVDAAAFLRSDLGVSKSLWGDACIAMGRERAAIAIAIVSTKDPAHFRTSAGGYFHGMVVKARAGHLNLDRTLWGMRRANQPRPSGNRGGGAGRGGEATGNRIRAGP